jgi:hypothetical protein
MNRMQSKVGGLDSSEDVRCVRFESRFVMDCRSVLLLC